MRSSGLPSAPVMASAEQGWCVPGVPLGEQPAVDPDAVLDFPTLEWLGQLEGLCAQAPQRAGGAGALVSMRLAERLFVLADMLQAAAERAAGQAAGQVDWITVAGHRSAKTWLQAAARVEPAAAAGILADDEFLAEYPVLARARETGAISARHVSVLRTTVTARRWRRERFPDVADMFAGFARDLDPGSLRTAIRMWAEQVDDQDAPDRPDPSWEDRAVHLAQVGDGWTLTGVLPRTDGMLLDGVLTEIMAAARRARCTCGQARCSCPPDDTPAPARRADALAQMARWAAEHTGEGNLLTTGGGARARALLVIPINRLTRDQLPPHLRHLAHPGTTPPPGTRPAPSPHPAPTPASPTTTAGPASPTGPTTTAGPAGPVTAADVDRILADIGIDPARWHTGTHTGTLNDRDLSMVLCDTEIQRLITTPDGLPLDLGRATRIISPALRAILTARDRGCLIPGCTAPANWCDAHHITPWSTGGTTAPHNLALLCRPHHRALHTGTWTITTTNGHPTPHRRP